MAISATRYVGHSWFHFIYSSENRIQILKNQTDNQKILESCTIRQIWIHTFFIFQICHGDKVVLSIRALLFISYFVSYLLVTAYLYSHYNFLTTKSPYSFSYCRVYIWYFYSPPKMLIFPTYIMRIPSTIIVTEEYFDIVQSSQHWKKNVMIYESLVPEGT